MSALLGARHGVRNVNIAKIARKKGLLLPSPVFSVRCDAWPRSKTETLAVNDLSFRLHTYVYIRYDLQISPVIKVSPIRDGLRGLTHWI